MFLLALKLLVSGGSYSALIVGYSVRFWDSRVHMGDRNDRFGILKEIDM